MPGISLTVSGQADPALTRRLALDLSELTCRVLKKEMDRTAVIIRYCPDDHWFIAGRSLQDYGKRAFRLEVTITGDSDLIRPRIPRIIRPRIPINNRPAFRH